MATCVSSCRGCRRIIDGDAVLCAAGHTHHPRCLDPRSQHGRITERDRQTVALLLASPKRADPRAIVADQADAAHLPLFVAANEPTLF